MIMTGESAGVDPCGRWDLPGRFGGQVSARAALIAASTSARGGVDVPVEIELQS